MCLNWLRRRLCVNTTPKPQVLFNIGYTEIYTILQSEFPDCYIAMMDRQYKTTTRQELMRYVKNDITDSRVYQPEYYDCEDFSFALMGALSNPDWGALPFGMLFVQTETGSAHAVNIFIDNNREVWMIEPQDDSIKVIPDGWKPYLIII